MASNQFQGRSESESIRQEAFRKVLLDIAQFYFVADSQDKSITELYGEFSILKTPLWKNVNDYYDAYNKWYEYYTTKSDHGAGLSPDGRIKLAKLIADCHKKKRQLLARFHQMRKENYES